MGAGYHGGFGDTKGSQTRKRIFTPVQYEGTVKVNGVERDVSRRVYQRDDINFEYIVLLTVGFVRNQSEDFVR